MFFATPSVLEDEKGTTDATSKSPSREFQMEEEKAPQTALGSGAVALHGETALTSSGGSSRPSASGTGTRGAAAQVTESVRHSQSPEAVAVERLSDRTHHERRLLAREEEDSLSSRMHPGTPSAPFDSSVSPAQRPSCASREPYPELLQGLLSHMEGLLELWQEESSRETGSVSGLNPVQVTHASGRENAENVSTSPPPALPTTSFLSPIDARVEALHSEIRTLRTTLSNRTSLIPSTRATTDLSTIRVPPEALDEGKEQYHHVKAEERSPNAWKDERESEVTTDFPSSHLPPSTMEQSPPCAKDQNVLPPDSRAAPNEAETVVSNALDSVGDEPSLSLPPTQATTVRDPGEEQRCPPHAMTRDSAAALTSGDAPSTFSEEEKEKQEALGESPEPRASAESAPPLSIRSSTHHSHAAVADRDAFFLDREGSSPLHVEVEGRDGPDLPSIAASPTVWRQWMHRVEQEATECLLKLCVESNWEPTDLTAVRRCVVRGAGVLFCTTNADAMMALYSPPDQQRKGKQHGGAAPRFSPVVCILSEFIRRGNAAVVQLLLESPHPLHFTSVPSAHVDGTTPLHWIHRCAAGAGVPESTQAPAQRPCRTPRSPLPAAPFQSTASPETELVLTGAPPAITIPVSPHSSETQSAPREDDRPPQLHALGSYDSRDSLRERSHNGAPTSTEKVLSQRHTAQQLLHLLLDRLESERGRFDTLNWEQPHRFGASCLSDAAYCGHLSTWWEVLSCRNVTYFTQRENEMVLSEGVCRDDWLSLRPLDRQRFRVLKGFLPF